MNFDCIKNEILTIITRTRENFLNVTYSMKKLNQSAPEQGRCRRVYDGIRIYPLIFVFVKKSSNGASLMLHFFTWSCYMYTGFLNGYSTAFETAAKNYRSL